MGAKIEMPHNNTKNKIGNNNIAPIERFRQRVFPRLRFFFTDFGLLWLWIHASNRITTASVPSCFWHLCGLSHTLLLLSLLLPCTTLFFPPGRPPPRLLRTLTSPFAQLHFLVPWHSGARMASSG